MIEFVEQEIFGRKLSKKERNKVRKDIFYIKFRYFRKRGFKNFFSLSEECILLAFYDTIVTDEEWDFSRITMSDWEEFVQIFNTSGVEFLEMYAYL